MKRTNLYLEQRQLDSLRGLAARRGVSVAALTRQALDEWLTGQGVRPIDPDAWASRFGELLGRRAEVAAREGWSQAEVDSDVAEAVAEVRGSRAAAGRR